LPEISARYSYNSKFFSFAIARVKAIETPRIALAPNFDLLFVPSKLIKKSSISLCEEKSFPLIAEAISELACPTAFKTPFPR